MMPSSFAFVRTAHALLLLAVLLVGKVTAHEHCCNKHKVDAAEAGLIPPDEYLGQKRFIPDPLSIRPDYWDDEDDGPWEPDLILNPSYTWQRKESESRNDESYFAKLVDEMKEAVPWVTLGVLITAFLDVFQMPLDGLRHLLSGNLGGGLAMLTAALIGLATPLCSCGALPVAVGFVAQGVPLSSSLAFLTASQSAGLDSAAITWGLLGPAAALFRLVGGLCLAVSAGMAVALAPLSSRPVPALAKECPSETEQRRLSGSVRFTVTLAKTALEIYPTVLVGLAISTLAVHLLPLTNTYRVLNDSSTLSAASPCLMRLGVLLSTLPLQLCEHSSVALAAGIQKAGGSPGLAFAFLLAAPATNLPSILMLLRQNGYAAARAAAALCGTALVFSYVVDALGMDMLVRQEAEGSGAAMATLPHWYVKLSPWFAGVLLVAGGFQKWLIEATSSSKVDENGVCSCPSEHQKMD